MAQPSIMHKTIPLLPRQKGFTKKFLSLPSIKKEAIDLKKILSKERINTIYAVKNKNPSSIYELSKILNKDFKAVYENTILLKDYGILTLKKNRSGKRISLQPILNVKKIDISIIF